MKSIKSSWPQVPRQPKLTFAAAVWAKPTGKTGLVKAK